MKSRLISALIACSMSGLVLAAPPAPAPEAAAPPAMNPVATPAPEVATAPQVMVSTTSRLMAIPIFSQYVILPFQEGFQTIFENNKDGQFIQEAVLQGETIEKWSQMLTLTGAQNLALNPKLAPMDIANSIATGYQTACPESFAAKGLSLIKIGNYDAFVSYLGCGTVKAEVAKQNGSTATKPYSESMLFIVIKGEKEFYTVQWAERGDASAKPLVFDETKWLPRFKKLGPLRVCTIGAPADSLNACMSGINKDTKK